VASKGGRKAGKADKAKGRSTIGSTANSHQSSGWTLDELSKAKKTTDKLTQRDKANQLVAITTSGQPDNLVVKLEERKGKRVEV
jgi:hypothetical protein